MASKRCPQKVRYRDELDAKIALASTARKDRDERRAYECPNCRGWHLTSRKKTQ